jgi:hypothetical protein
MTAAYFIVGEEWSVWASTISTKASQSLRSALEFGVTLPSTEAQDHSTDSLNPSLLSSQRLPEMSVEENRLGIHREMPRRLC